MYILKDEMRCAFAGEVTLTGRVLPIGGVKEKAIAARRSGVKTLIFPKANQHDFEELSGQLSRLSLLSPAVATLHSLKGMLHSAAVLLYIETRAMHS